MLDIWRVYRLVHRTAGSAQPLGAPARRAGNPLGGTRYLAAAAGLGAVIAFGCGRAAARVLFSFHGRAYTVRELTGVPYATALRRIAKLETEIRGVPRHWPRGALVRWGVYAWRPHPAHRSLVDFYRHYLLQQAIDDWFVGEITRKLYRAVPGYGKIEATGIYRTADASALAEQRFDRKLLRGWLARVAKKLPIEPGNSFGSRLGRQIAPYEMAEYVAIKKYFNGSAAPFFRGYYLRWVMDALIRAYATRHRRQLIARYDRDWSPRFCLVVSLPPRGPDGAAVKALDGLAGAVAAPGHGLVLPQLTRASHVLYALGWGGQIHLVRNSSVVLAIYAGLTCHAFPVAKGIVTTASGRPGFRHMYMYAFRARTRHVLKRYSLRTNGPLFNTAARVLCLPIAAKIQAGMAMRHQFKMPTAVALLGGVSIPKDGLYHGIRIPLPKAPRYHAPKSRG